MQTADYQLIIGNKAWSSWSLRPWLAMTANGIAFEEINIPLRRTDSKARILGLSPSGKVPALKAGDLVIWDSLAILEFLAERHRKANLWPPEPKARAVARAVSAEMHSGFQSLRREMPMDLLNIYPTPDIGEAVRADIERIMTIWKMCLARSGGPFLFGAFSIADAMYAPVVARLRTYSVPMADFGDDGSGGAYCQTIWSMEAMGLWEQGARSELAPQLPPAGSFG